MRTLIRFFVPGIPKPGGSKTATLIRRRGGEIVMKNGRPLITTRDDAKGNGEWKQTVAFFARQSYQGAPLAPFPLRVAVTFYMPRPKGHYGTGRNAGRLKITAPAYHTVKPDGTKLMRALEDACTGIIWSDDAMIAEPWPSKVYGDKPGALVCVYALEDVQLGRPEEPAEAAELFAAGGAR